MSNFTYGHNVYKSLLLLLHQNVCRWERVNIRNHCHWSFPTYSNSAAGIFKNIWIKILKISFNEIILTKGKIAHHEHFLLCHNLLKNCLLHMPKNTFASGKGLSLTWTRWHMTLFEADSECSDHPNQAQWNTDHIFAGIYSKSSAADLLYVGKGKRSCFSLSLLHFLELATTKT